MKSILIVARKEMESYFGSPMAFIFLGAFLAVTLFTFFWIDGFFARGVADLRPLFKSLPLLLIMLVAALCMRQWSEEERAGTLEILLTLPVRPVYLVLGKFFAVLGMVTVALVLTAPLLVTVALLGNIDLGPIAAGYLASLLLAGAYAAIGLWVSSRTTNQIVALIGTGIVGGLFYLIGSPGLTDFVGGGMARLMRALGTGSRFASIERGVIDLRDLVYYLSLTGIFLLLNTLSLDRKRWSQGERTRGYRRDQRIMAAVGVLNLLLLNVWLFPLATLRLDITQNREYSLSDTTRGLVRNLTEPLLLRAYLSENTHPLLAPLRPQIIDLLREYAVISGGRVTTEVIDPLRDPQAEEEAVQTYGIQSTPFQVAGRYESGVVNSYFDILVSYGDQFETLGFQDLIDVEAGRDGSVQVRLRNLEYDITRAIKKSAYSFQTLDSLLAGLTGNPRLMLIVTPQTLPEELAEAPELIAQVASGLAARSGGSLSFEVIDPDESAPRLTRQEIFDTYGLRPATTLFSPRSYYLDLILHTQDRPQVVGVSGELTETTLRTGIEAALKRTASGFLKTVALWRPPATPTTDPFGRQVQPLASWNLLDNQLRGDYRVVGADLSSGHLPADVDALVVLQPQALSDLQRFAIDQFLMRGGAVVIAGNQYLLEQDPFSGQLQLRQLPGGANAVVQPYGVTVGSELVMDPQNLPFVQAVTRRLSNGAEVRDYESFDYPFFIDVRSDGMSRTSPVTGTVPSVVLQWASPVLVGDPERAGLEAEALLQSTADAWLRTETSIQPDVQAYPQTGFPVGPDTGRQDLAVSLRGSFTSAFAGAAPPTPEGDGVASPPTGVLEVSPETARLVVIGSSEFLNDAILQGTGLSQDRYLNNLQFLQNAVDWAVEDSDLLQIRSRGVFTRLLRPLDEPAQRAWELLNYGVALVGLLGVAGIWYVRRRQEQPMQLVDEQGAEQ